MQKRTRRILALLCAGVLSVVGVFSGLHFGCTFPILLEDAEHGTIYCTKSRARLFSSAVICLYPEQGFTIERVTVNGEDQTEKLQRDRLTLRFIHGEIVVHASFKKTGGQAAFDAVFVAKKNGSAGYAEPFSEGYMQERL